MRPDMKHVVRHNHHKKHRKIFRRLARRRRRYQDWEDAPSFEGMASKDDPWYDRGSRGDHVEPLRGFLRKNIGRPWDDVWSEICQFADPRSSRGYHLRHVVLEWEVTVYKTYDKDGYLWSRKSYYRGPKRAEDTDGFYVGPDGILREGTGGQSRYTRRNANKQDVKKISEHREYRRLNGIWYSVVLKDIPRNFPREAATSHPAWLWYIDNPEDFLCPRYEHFTDVVTGKNSQAHGRRAAVRWRQYAYSKKQMNSQELKKAGLSNEASLDHHG